MIQEEIVDIVNENDVVLDQASKIIAHQQGLLHRTIISELIDSQGNWTLVRQASDRQDAGKYVSPVGGHIRAGESESSALERESIEEVGIKPIIFNYVGKAIYNRKVLGRKENHFFIVYEIYTDKTPGLNHESDSFKTYTTDEITQLIKEKPEIFGDAFHFVIQQFYPQFLE